MSLTLTAFATLILAAFLSMAARKTNLAFGLDNSPLRRLPVELRLDIYERVLQRANGMKVTLNPPRKYRKKITKPHSLALRFTCKVIYRETTGIVFAINDTWRFSHPNDDSDAWGKRAQAWFARAGPRCLQRAKAVQFDIGTWIVRSSGSQRRNPESDVYSEVGSMYVQLPPELTRREIAHSIKLRIDWTEGITLACGDVDRLLPVPLLMPLFQPQRHFNALVEGAMKDYVREVGGRLSDYKARWKSRHVGVRDRDDPRDFGRESARMVKEILRTAELMSRVRRSVALEWADREYWYWEERCRERRLEMRDVAQTSG